MLKTNNVIRAMEEILFYVTPYYMYQLCLWLKLFTTAAPIKSLQSCPTLHDAIDGSPPGSSVRGILQARILKWVVSFSNACMHAKSLQSCPTLRPHRRQPTRLLCPQDSLDKNTGVGCHFLLHFKKLGKLYWQLEYIVIDWLLSFLFIFI